MTDETTDPRRFQVMVAPGRGTNHIMEVLVDEREDGLGRLPLVSLCGLYSNRRAPSLRVRYDPDAGLRTRAWYELSQVRSHDCGSCDNVRASRLRADSSVH